MRSRLLFSWVLICRLCSDMGRSLFRIHICNLIIVRFFFSLALASSSTVPVYTFSLFDGM